MSFPSHGHAGRGPHFPFANLEGFLAGVPWASRSSGEVVSKHGLEFLRRLAEVCGRSEPTAG